MTPSTSQARAPRRRSWALWTVLALTVVIIAGLVISGITNRRTGPALQVTDEHELRLEGLLTKDNLEFNTKNLAASIHDELPSPLRSLFPKGRGESFTLASIGDGELDLYFTPAFRQGMRRGRSQAEAEDEMKKYFSSQKRPMVRLRYGPGYYSQANGISSWTTSRGSELYSTNLSGVPGTVKNVELQLVTYPDVPEQVLSSVALPNPIYRPVAPLESTSTLPLIVTHAGVSVTLENHIAKTVDPYARIKRRDQQGDSNYPKLESDEFLRAAGTLTDQYHGAAVITISEVGTTASEWRLAENVGLKFHYGKTPVPFGPVAPSVKLLETTGSKTTYLVSYLEDLDLLDQPVKVSVKLERTGNFQPDEEQTVSVAIPATGTTTKVVTPVPLWSGSIAVEVGNQAQFDPEFIKSPTTDFLTVVLNGNYKDLRILQPRLEGPEGRTLNLAPYRLFDDYRSGAIALNFATAKGRGAKHKPVVLGQYTTVSLTLRSPRHFPTPFEFIATPTDATVPAAPPSL